MARSSGEKSQQIRPSVKCRPEAFKEMLGRTASKLIEQGRLLWLLGEGLNAATAVQRHSGETLDELTLVGHITKLVQDWNPKPACPITPANPKNRSKRPQPDHVNPRPTLVLIGRSLAEAQCPVLWIGSREMCAGLWTSMAVGVGTDGFVRILGVTKGAVREQAVSDALLGDLVARGLDIGGGVVVVTEGCRALDKVLQQQWKGRAHVAHCRLQLRHEVLQHVAPSALAAVALQLDTAWSLEPDGASALLRDLEEKLSREAPGASERLARSREASLLAARLGVPLPLRDRLESAGTFRMIFNKSRQRLANSETFAETAGGLERLQQTRRLRGWKQLELLSLTLRALQNSPQNNAAPKS
jgi:hypothetical protein